MAMEVVLEETREVNTNARIKRSCNEELSEEANIRTSTQAAEESGF